MGHFGHEESHDIEINPVIWFLANLTPRRAAIIISVTAVTLIGAGTFGDARAASATAAQYETVPAVIIDEPTFAYGAGKYGTPVVAATVETETGQRINIAVDNQAHTGDTVTVYRNIDSGELFRSTAAGATPHTPTLYAGWGVVGALFVLAALLGSSLWAGNRLDEQRRTQRRATNTWTHSGR